MNDLTNLELSHTVLYFLQLLSCSKRHPTLLWPLKTRVNTKKKLHIYVCVVKILNEQKATATSLSALMIWSL